MVSLISQWSESGKSQQAYCKEHGIAYSKFHYWQKKLRQEDAGQTGFMSISVNDKVDASARSVEVVYPDGRRVVFMHGVGVEFLRALMS